jgi:hypothetical protein
MTDAAVRHQDQRVVSGLQDQPHVLLERSIGALQQQVGACQRQDVAVQARAGERAARHRHDAAVAGGRTAQLLDGMQRHADREQRAGLKLGHADQSAAAALIRPID